MKKLFSFVAVAAAISFAACTGNKAESAAQDEACCEGEKTEECGKCPVKAVTESLNAALESGDAQAIGQAVKDAVAAAGELASVAAALAELNHLNEESIRAVEQAKQERIAREERMVAGAEASIAQKELLEQQVEIVQRQNALLLDNYLKLKEMFDAQAEANQEAKEELKRSKRFNFVMMIIAIIAMLAAIAGPIATIWVSK